MRLPGAGPGVVRRTLVEHHALKVATWNTIQAIAIAEGAACLLAPDPQMRKAVTLYLAIREPFTACGGLRVDETGWPNAEREADSNAD